MLPRRPTVRIFAARAVLFLLCAGGLTLAPLDAADAGRRRQNPPHEPVGHLTWASPQSNPIALSPDGTRLAVVSTTSNQVDLIDTGTQTVVAQVEVGMEPVSVAYKPDGSELWVSNHVSDTISVIDPTTGSVTETIQDLDANGATRFDEPVGIAFKEDGSQAYVALSSRNDVAIIDTSTYAVTGRVHITAQEPRALAVRNGRLYVAAFESGNQSELSACGSEFERTDECSILAVDLSDVLNPTSDLLEFATNPNMPGTSKNIVIDPDVPDRDLFVFDISAGGGLSDGASPDDVLSGVGTLLYGLTVSSTDRVYVTQTHARNAVNGLDSRADSPSDVNNDGDVNLGDLKNRMFLNQIAEVDCSGSCTLVGGTPHELEPVPAPGPGGGPAVPTPLATPYGVALAESANLLLATAAASSRVFSWDTSSGSVLDALDVESIPRGVALDPTHGPNTGRAYVLNTLANSVSVVDVNLTTGALTAVGTPIAVGNDPTPDAVRLGRIAFNDAGASSSGTFSCASCHPDGNGDQLLWRIGGECFLGGCVSGEDEPRSTMPVRGLRDSLPLHWDGTLGDPFGEGNGAVGVNGNGGTSCALGDADAAHDCFMDLVDGSLSGVMCDQLGACPAGGNELTAQERDDMATFLERVAYPPARSRRMNDVVSAQGDPTPVQVGSITVGGLEGFEDFFFDQGSGSLNVSQPDTCADSDAGCHELPLGTGTNSETLNGFDAPTMRGMTDRFLQFSLGISNAEELLVFANPGLNIPANIFPPNGLVVEPIEAPIQWDAAVGFEEVTTFAAAFAIFEPTYGVRPLDMFQMFEEASTGHSGALGRQVTVSAATTAGCPVCDVEDILDDLEGADEDLLVNLRGAGRFFGTARTVSFDATAGLAGLYRFLPGAGTRTRSALIADAQAGNLTVTLTGHLREHVSEDVSQPLIAPIGAQCDADNGGSGDPTIPGGNTITIESAHVDANDVVLLNGQPTAATIQLLGTPDVCDTQGGPQPDAPDEVTPEQIQISNIPRTGGTDLLQIQSTEGLLSNELPLP